MQQHAQQTADTAHQNYVVAHDFSGSRELSTTVTHVLADIVGADVSIVERTLFQEVDRLAFDRLFHKRNSGGLRRTHFGLRAFGHAVTVYSDGQIVVTPPA